MLGLDVKLAGIGHGGAPDRPRPRAFQRHPRGRGRITRQNGGYCVSFLPACNNDVGLDAGYSDSCGFYRCVGDGNLLSPSDAPVPIWGLTRTSELIGLQKHR
jgi:hypothetical protein